MVVVRRGAVIFMSSRVSTAMTSGRRWFDDSKTKIVEGNEACKNGPAGRWNFTKF
jgi:hypothetical protein